eukprot:15150062-Heterocapsa_arctica.AAC.1
MKHVSRVAIEWPTGCAYWHYPKVLELQETFQLQRAQGNGCAMGLINDNGVPIRKPWTIATNDGCLWRAMSGCKCLGKAAHPNHQPCAGKYTRLMEEYTWPMTDLVHAAWQNSMYALDKGLETPEAKVFRDLSRGVIPAMPCVARVSKPVASKHRDKIGEEDPAYNAMVARLLTAKEFAEDPKAQQAILKEDAKANGEKIHLARVFPMCSEQGSELPTGDPDHKMKGRCVFQVSDVRDENDQTAILSGPKFLSSDA